MLTILALTTLLATQEAPVAPRPLDGHRIRVISTDGPGSLDTDGDGEVSRDEFAAPMNDHFARMDRDRDGRLSEAELSGGHGGDRLMVMRDGDDDSHGPGVHRFELRRPGSAEGPGHARTMVFTGGGDGLRGEHEIIIRGPGGEGGHHVVHHGGEGMAGDGRIEVRRIGGGRDGPGDLDKDGDGRVSEGEFTAPLREAFARMDADQSGFVEAGERGGDGEVRVFTHRIETRDGDDD